MGYQWPKSEHDILWFEVPVEEADLIQLLHTSDDSVEDLVLVPEAPLFLQPLPEAHLEGVELDGEVVNNQVDPFVLALVRGVPLSGQLEDGQVVLCRQLLGAVHGHFLEAVNPKNPNHL
jgi:hypothetical protein